MAFADLTDWIDEFGRPGAVWYGKRLSANDTLANQTHQAGPYIPKDLLFRVLPELNRPEAENPDTRFNLYLDSHADHKVIRAVWYNGRLRGSGTRNEARLTGFGGAASALLDPDSTGALAVFVFRQSPDGQPECHVWVCRNGVEEDVLEERLGPVEPKQMIVWEPDAPETAKLYLRTAGPADCSLGAVEIPPGWLERFPSGEQIVRMTLAQRPAAGAGVDVRLLRRRQCEFEIFRSVEHAYYMPRVQEGFPSLDSFIGLAQTILQSRKSRSGNSLELHAREIFGEEGLVSEADFSHRPVIEGGKRPDFLFPSTASYNDPEFPAGRLRMMAAKTTVKDRWRQVLNEAGRIQVKHLLTLQEGVSEGQFREMQEAKVHLIVPFGIHESYPEAVRPHLISLESFISDVRLLRRG